MTAPFVSCICPTFGRAPEYLHLLGEAVESFLRQDYPADRRELIVLNDCPGQQLTCDAPGVRVVNYPVRAASLGAKYNVGVHFSRGELLCTWEDDDISLPNRLSLSVERIGGKPYFNPRAYWYMPSNDLIHEQNTGYAHNASMFTREAWKQVGGYPEMSGAQDAAMDGRLRSLGDTVLGPLAPEESFYIYRWGVSDIHLSAHPNTESAYHSHGARPHAQGNWLIVPLWQQDYAELTRHKATLAGQP